MNGQTRVHITLLHFLLLASEGQLGRYIYITEWSVVWATVIPRLIVLDRTYMSGQLSMSIVHTSTHKAHYPKQALSLLQQIKVEKNLRPRLTKANHVEVEGKVDSSIHQ